MSLDTFLPRVSGFFKNEGIGGLWLNKKYWAPVSEPGFLDFQISDSRDFCFLQNMFEQNVGDISGNKS